MCHVDHHQSHQNSTWAKQITDTQMAHHRYSKTRMRPRPVNHWPYCQPLPHVSLQWRNLGGPKDMIELCSIHTKEKECWSTISTFMYKISNKTIFYWCLAQSVDIFRLTARWDSDQHTILVMYWSIKIYDFTVPAIWTSDDLMISAVVFLPLSWP